MVELDQAHEQISVNKIRCYWIQTHARYCRGNSLPNAIKSMKLSFYKDSEDFMSYHLHPLEKFL